jgi:hypothetical protein
MKRRSRWRSDGGLGEYIFKEMYFLRVEWRAIDRFLTLIRARALYYLNTKPFKSRISKLLRKYTIYIFDVISYQLIFANIVETQFFDESA